MYQKIVVGTDGSGRAGRAVEHAAELARLCGAELHLVLGCASPVIGADHYGGTAVDPTPVVEACEAALAPLAERLRHDGVDTAVHVVNRSGPAAVCGTAATIDSDLIVVGSRGMTGARRMLGSVPNSIAHQAPCSVLIVETE